MLSWKQAGKKLLTGVILAGIMALGTVTAQAAGPLYRNTYPSKVTNKLGRGLGNVIFCWCEFPIEINREIQNTDPVTGTVVGFGRGLWFTVRRLGLGVVDIVTFPIDIFGNNFQSVQRTEFPFIDEVE